MTALLCRLAPLVVFFFFMPGRFVSFGLRLGLAISLLFCVYPAELLSVIISKQTLPSIPLPEILWNFSWGLAVMLSVSLPVLALLFFCTWISRLSVLEKRYSQLFSGVTGRKLPMALSSLLTLVFICVLLHSGATEVLVWTLISSVKGAPLNTSALSREGFSLLSSSFLIASFFLFPVALAYLSFYFAAVFFERLFSKADLFLTSASLAKLILTLSLLVVLIDQAQSISELLSPIDSSESLLKGLKDRIFVR